MLLFLLVVVMVFILSLLVVELVVGGRGEILVVVVIVVVAGVVLLLLPLYPSSSMQRVTRVWPPSHKDEGSVWATATPTIFGGGGSGRPVAFS